MDILRKSILTVIGLAAVLAGFLVSNDLHQIKKKPTPPVNVEQNKSSKDFDYFDHAYHVILGHEGGFTDDSTDKGGATKYGISLAFLKAENIDVDGDGDIDIDDIKVLTKEKSEDLYYKIFWIKNSYNQIESEEIAIKLMDTAVNMGASRAHKILKNSLNAIMMEDIKVNGVLDEETIEIINIIDSSILLAEFRKEQAAFYQYLIDKTPAYIKYKNGWMNRAKS